MNDATPTPSPTPLDDAFWPVKSPLWHHQRKALAKSVTSAAYAFHFDPGLGKTATVIAEAGRMFLDGDIDTLVVIAPARVHRQWVEKQFPRWADFPWKGMFWPKGGFKAQYRKEQAKKLAVIEKVHPKLRVFTVNIENTRIAPRRRLPDGSYSYPKRTPAMKYIDHLIKTSEKGVYIAIDEGHRIKDDMSQQSRAIHTYGRGVGKVRRILTGTPVLQGVHDLYSQYVFLDPLIIGENSFPQFRERFCKTRPVPGRPNAVIITGGKDEDKLMSRIEPYTSRVLDTDVLDMPDRVWNEFVVEMSPKQRKAYDQMNDLMIAGLSPDKVVTASIVLTQLQKLSQIASGFIMDENKDVTWLSDNKIDAIAERVADLGKPVVVWAPFIPLLDRLEVALPNAVRFREMADLDEWMKKGGPLVANPASGGTGVDGMQFAHHAFYAANSLSLEHRIQSIKRTHRGDQKRTCFYTDFMSENSRDADVIASLNAKRDIGTMTVDTLREILTTST